MSSVTRRHWPSLDHVRSGVVGLAFLAMLLPAANGCGSDGDATPGTHCAGACRTVQRCVSEQGRAFDTSSCEAQCGAELAGNGHLHSAVATKLFRILAEHTDTSCSQLEDSSGWGFSVIYGDRYRDMPGRERLRRCSEIEGQLCDGDPNFLTKLCFEEIYRRPEDVWLRAEACMDQSYEGAFSVCGAYSKCRNEATGILRGQPWLGASLAD